MQGGKVRVKADVHHCKTEASMYEQISRKKAVATNEDERSSSGNWSTTSSSTGATSSTATTKSPTQPEDDGDIAQRTTIRSACCLSNGQSADLTKKKINHSCMNRSTGRMKSGAESGPVQCRPQQQSAANRSKFANRDSESWLQFFESNESTDTITNEMNAADSGWKHSDARKSGAQPNDAELKLKNGKFKGRASQTKNRSDSISSNLEEHEDELLSIHSLDTDGYYTSMHTDSGLMFRERALPLNSTFLSNDEEPAQSASKENQTNQPNRPACGNQPINKLSPSQQQTKSFIDALKKNGKSAPSPPPRSCSVMSSSSTLNNIQQLTTCSSATVNSVQTDCDRQDQQDSSSVCSDATLSGATEPSSQLTSEASNVPRAAELKRAGDQQTNTVASNKQADYQPPSITSPSPANTWCSSSMNSDIDLVKLRSKTTIDPTSAYPSMVAYPESELSSISSFGNLAFASSGNHRCTVISKSRSASDHQQFTNQFSSNACSNTSYSNGHHHNHSQTLSKKESTSSLDSKMSKRSLSTLGSYASLTKLKELLKPLRNTLTGRSSEKKSKEDSAKKKPQSKDDCYADEVKNGKRKGFFTRFGSINRGRIVKSNHLEKLQSTEKAAAAESEQDDLIKLRNTINKWRIEPLNNQQEASKLLNKSKESSAKQQQQFAEEDENEYYAKLSQQSNNVLRNSVDYSLNHDLKRFSIASSHSQGGSVDCNSYLYKKHHQQHLNLSASLNLPPNQSPANKENRRSADAALMSKYFPVSRYTSKVQPEPSEHQFLVPALPGPVYYENLANTRYSYASTSGCSNSLALSNNSALYASIPARPKTLNLSASLSTPFNQPIYGQTVLSNSYNGSFGGALPNRPFLTNGGQVISNSNSLNGLQYVVNGQSLNSSTSSAFYPAGAHQIMPPPQQPNTTNPFANNALYTNVNMLNNHPHLNQPMYHPAAMHHPNQLNPHQQPISSSSSHQSSSSLSYNYSASSSLVNTPSSLSSPSPFHHPQQTSQMNAIKANGVNQFTSKNQPNSTTNTAIVSPFCKQTIQSTDSLKKSDEKLSASESKTKRSSDDSVLNRSSLNGQQVMFRDSMRLTRQQREQTLARIQRSSWTPSSSMISSPSGSLESSSNSSTDQSAPCNDINKLISELSNFDVRPQPDCQQDEEKKLMEQNQLDAGHHQMMNGKSDSIYGVNIARTKFSFPLLQNENAIKGDLNVLKQSNGTDMDDFKKLLSAKAQMNGTVKKSASEQLKIARKPLSALNADEERPAESAELNGTGTGYYEKETYDNVTDEEYEHLNRTDFRANSSLISMVQANGQLNGFGSNLRTRVINGRVYKTPYRLEQMMYPPINENEEDNNGEDEFNLSASTQQKTSTWV